MAFGLAATAETVVNISGVGAQKFTVSIQVANGAYSKCLAKNLEISGLFTVRSDGTIKVSGGSGAVSLSPCYFQRHLITPLVRGPVGVTAAPGEGSPD